MKTKNTFLMAALIFAGTWNAVWAENALQIAKSKDVTGKFQQGACDDFARDLFTRYEQAGKEAYHIVYRWEKMDRESQNGKHALIVFKDESGRFYAMDNLTWKPVWLKGQTPREWVKFFSGMDVDTQVVSHVATTASRRSMTLALR
jgi:hypothetical protein